MEKITNEIYRRWPKARPIVETLSDPTYLRILAARKQGLEKGDTIPTLTTRFSQPYSDRERVASLREVCHFSKSSAVPLTFPHIVASQHHLKLMLDKNFPLPILGLVHLRNEIRCYEPIEVADPLDFECGIKGHREVEKGIEFDLVTKVGRNGNLVWESTSTILSRKKTDRKKKTPGEDFQRENSTDEEWQISINEARKYALVSGDLNPIHLHPVSAKIFGFKAAIIHGMWSLGRAAAALEKDWRDGGAVVNCEFKLPCFLPAKVLFRSWTRDDHTGFLLLSKDGTKPHMVGQIAPIAET